MKNSLLWYPNPSIKNDYKIGLLGNFGRMYSLLTSEACVFRVLRRTECNWSRAQFLSLYKNACALVVTESEKS